MLNVIIALFFELSFLVCTGLLLSLLFRIKYEDNLEMFSVSLVGGYFVQYILTLLLAFSGLLYSYLIIFLMIISLIINIFLFKGKIWVRIQKFNNNKDIETKKKNSKEPSNEYRILYFVLSAILLFILLNGYYYIALSPFLDGENMANARIFKIMAHYHKHIVLEDEYMYWMPLTVATIDLFNYLAGGIALVKISRLIFVFLIWQFCKLFSKKYFHTDFSPFVMLILLTTEVSNELVFNSILKPHLCGGAFGMCAIWLYLNKVKIDRDTIFKGGEIAFSGIILGFASLVIFQTGILLLYSILHLSIRFVISVKNKKETDFKCFLYYVLPAIAIAIIWPVRSLILKGDLLYPFGYFSEWNIDRSLFAFFEQIIQFSKIKTSFIYVGQPLYGAKGFGPIVGVSIILLIWRRLFTKNLFYNYIFPLIFLCFVLNYGIALFFPRYFFLAVILLSFVGGDYFYTIYNLSKTSRFLFIISIGIFIIFYCSYYSFYNQDYKKYMSEKNYPHLLPSNVIEVINNIIDKQPESIWGVPFSWCADYYMNTKNIKTLSYPPTPFAKEIFSLNNVKDQYNALKKANIHYLIYSDMWKEYYWEYIIKNNKMDEIAFSDKKVVKMPKEKLLLFGIDPIKIPIEKLLINKLDINSQYIALGYGSDLASYNDDFLELIYAGNGNSSFYKGENKVPKTYVFKLK